MITARTTGRPIHLEAWLALAYFGTYMVYHFAKREGEVLHWVSFVALPIGLLYLLNRRTAERPLRNTFASIGLQRGNLRRGLGWGVLVGVFATAVNLLTQQGRAFLGLVQSGEALYLYPLSLLLMLVFAGTTEEVFFRGVLQTRLESLFRSVVAGILATAVLFSVYHLPFASFNPNWPSAGHWPNAIRAAFTNGMLGGIVLGAVYAKARHNLLAPIIGHAMVNAIPGVTLIQRVL
jgi:membrane protease YdiL (CAAX protease family)